MRSYETRFPNKAASVVVSALAAAPVGSTATIRAVVFRKDSARSWSNDFRSGMTAADVASVLGEQGTIHPPQTEG